MYVIVGVQDLMIVSQVNSEPSLLVEYSVMIFFFPPHVSFEVLSVAKVYQNQKCVSTIW